MRNMYDIYFKMFIILLLSTLLIGQMIYPPDYQYKIRSDGIVEYTTYSNWHIQSPRKWQVQSTTIEMKHKEFLSKMLIGWITHYDLHDFLQLSLQWSPDKKIIIVDPNIPVEPPVVDPNEVVLPIITFRIAATTKIGGVYHLPSCRYIRDNAKILLPGEEMLYVPCSICNPDDINYLLQ